MSRRKLIWFPGAKYHITSRGVRKTDLFYDEEDRYKYLYTLEMAMKMYPFFLHTYCLMTNHIHLQIETKHFPPSYMMRYINTKYAKHYNQKYEHSGHVFDKRYSAELIDSTRYEIELSKYIHLNPLKANIVDKLEDYPWSSYPIYIHKINTSFVTTKQILSYFSEPKTEEYEKYLKANSSVIIE